MRKGVKHKNVRFFNLDHNALIFIFSMNILLTENFF